MDYTNAHGVCFKIHSEENDYYKVKYYPRNARFPRVYDKFQCRSDAMRSEMFFILSKLRFCSCCSTDLLGYRDERDVCKACLLRQSSEKETEIAECPVCFQSMLTLDGSKVQLTCQHFLCLMCMKRMAKSTAHVHYEQTFGPYVVKQVKCPLCRTIGHYDYLYRATVPNSTI